MVGEPGALVDHRPACPGRDARGGDLVVDAPAHVLRPRLAAIGPPGVALAGGVRMQPPVDVHPADLGEYATDPLPLLGQEARIFLIGAPVFQIDLLVRDVPVAAQHDLAPRPSQLLQMGQEFLQEAKLRLLPFLGARAGRQVDADDRQLAEIRTQVTAFAVELPAAETVRDLVRFALGIETDAAIAALLGGIEIRLRAVSVEMHVGEIDVLRFELLHAHDMPGLHRIEPGKEPLALGATDAIQVESDDAHGMAEKTQEVTTRRGGPRRLYSGSPVSGR